MGGDNALSLVGTGVLTLAVANTYTQGTTHSGGTLKCGNVASLGTGGLVQANSTTLHVTATGGKLIIQGAHTNTGTGNRTIRIGA
jgi:fibronectin-binding autotransporter adhesin